jgi:Carbohydrate binding module (family 6)/Right handed beta helix region
VRKLVTTVVCLAACLTAGVAGAATLKVNAGGDLQAALNAALPGDTILLQAGATFTGNFVLPVKSGSGDITIRSSASDASLPAAGVRITPAYASLLPKLRSTSNGAALATAAGTSHWRLMFLEFTPAPGTTTADLVELGSTGVHQNTSAQVPHHFIVDRAYFHGDPTNGQRRGIALNSASTQVINSYFADFKGRNVDTQAICGWNGPGPYLIENNYLEAAGENVMFGGSDPSVPGLVPSNITVRHNLISRPLAWMSEGWTVKNLVEFKNAETVVVEGNVIENHWAGGQPGYAIVITPRNQNHTAPWSVTRDITIQNNVIRHVSGVFNILGYDNLAPSGQTENITVRNNLLYDVNTRYGPAGTTVPARLAIIGAGPKNVRFDHNTVDNNGASTIFFYGGATPTGIVAVYGFELTNNLLRQNSWLIYGDAIGQGQPALDHYAPNATVLHNTFAGAAAKLYPIGNDFPTVAQWLADFAGPAAGNYQLRSTSLSRGAATDGTDIGVDFAELNAALAAPPTGAQPPSVPPAASTPFTGQPIALPGRIDAENYDKGGEGVAFHDSTAGNTGAVYRTDGADVQATADTGGGYNLGWTAAGEWLQYAVNVTTSRSYAVDVRVASKGAGGTFHIEVDRVNVTGAIVVPNTGGWQIWTTLSKAGITLNAGPHLVRLVMDSVGASGSVANLNWIAVR